MHFDPFANAALVDRLAEAPPSAWAAIFASDTAQRSPGVGRDTNAALLRSALAAMRAADPNPPVVAIAGDFLAHHFRERYDRTRSHAPAEPALGDAAYARFMDATIAYLADAFGRAFPRARFLVTIGNNDGYCGDYASTPGSPFLSHFARTWAPLVDRYGDVPDFARTFPRSGAYVARLPLAGDRRALVTNSVLWSTDYGNVCARNDGSAQRDELAWMTRAVASGGPATRWWLLTHIPPGIDVVSSIEVGRATPMYESARLRELRDLPLSGGHPFELVIAGHAHASAFRLLPSRLGTVPVAIVPAITPVNGNGPAFAVARVRPDGAVADEIVYAARQPVLGGAPAWYRSYAFDDVFGQRGFDVASLERARGLLETDLATRDRYYGGWFPSGGISGALELAVWRREWCAIRVGGPRDYDRCRSGRR